jgi:uncharacterized protein (TIGR02598 family)
METGAAAFSLVEVVIAIAVVSFALIGLIALFSVGLTTNRQSADQTNVSAMAWQVMTGLRSQTNYTQANAFSTTNYFFDTLGQSNYPATNAYYSCAITLSTQTALNSANATNMGAKLVFTWPSVTNPPHTNTIYASLPLSNH